MKTGSFLNRRTGKAAALAFAALLLATMIRPDPPAPDPGPARSFLVAVPVPLDPADPGRRQVGALVFRRGWHLTSDEPRFGGVSAMDVSDGQVTAVSDAGTLFEFALPTSAAPIPLRVQPLAGGRNKSARDIEAMLVDDRHVWVAFERRNAVVRFRRRDWRPQQSAQPPPMQGWRGFATAATSSSPKGATTTMSIATWSCSTAIRRRRARPLQRFGIDACRVSG
jgi:hypothetical protein